MVDQPQQADQRSFVRRRAVPLLAAATLTSIFVAAYFAGQTHALRQANQATTAQAAASGVDLPSGLKLPTLDATAAFSSEKFSMATGFVSTNAEGLFVLDHNSGLLQCSVMYPRLGQFLGLFVVNVHDALGTGKGAEYMMMTGLVDMPSSNSNPLASSVVYVLNTTTGMYACYYIPFNRSLMNANKPQQGNLVLLATGSADPVVDRDAIR
ncbi:hypothetical protein [Stieleria sp.]|uniref:hypothetical protein n=1 Tax=Stieleria sp. TaxID=2795976 RepID=UPI0035635574